MFLQNGSEIVIGGLKGAKQGCCCITDRIESGLLLHSFRAMSSGHAQEEPSRSCRHYGVIVYHTFPRRGGKRGEEMVGTRRLELLTSTVSR
jgi:hypothetical protein